MPVNYSNDWRQPLQSMVIDGHQMAQRKMNNLLIVSDSVLEMRKHKELRTGNYRQDVLHLHHQLVRLNNDMLAKWAIALPAKQQPAWYQHCKAVAVKQNENAQIDRTEMLLFIILEAHKQNDTTVLKRLSPVNWQQLSLLKTDLRAIDYPFVMVDYAKNALHDEAVFKALLKKEADNANNQ